LEITTACSGSVLILLNGCSCNGSEAEFKQAYGCKMVLSVSICSIYKVHPQHRRGYTTETLDPGAIELVEQRASTPPKKQRAML
jgi:hypothetical protein